MKKNRKIVLIFFIIIVLCCISFFILKNINNVEKFSLCTIETYDGVEIDEYKSNKRAFIISNFDKNAVVTVNGEKYIEGTGFYDIGEYKIEVTLENKIEKSTVKINKIDNKNEYNIFITAETLPTFFASFDMIKEKEIPAYIWYQRADTLNVEALKNMFKNVTISEYIGEEKSNTFFGKVIPEIQGYVNNILKEDENAHFNVYVTAEFYWMELAALGRLGLGEDRVNVIMYSCGTIDYVVDYSFTDKNTYNTFIDKKKVFEDSLDKIRSNMFENDALLKVLQNNGRYDSDYVLINSFRENVKYYLQYPELIKFNDEKVKEEMKKANMIKIVANAEFNKLSQTQKDYFFKCINLDKEYFDKEYFNDENGKYLIITGTRPFYGKYNKKEFKNIISQVIEKYDNEYSILYKPHPKGIPEGEEEKILIDAGIKILPGQMPMEAISFVYNDLKLGGFASSLYMSVDEGSTLFFFENGKENLVEPLNILYEDMFKGTEFLTPNI